MDGPEIPPFFICPISLEIMEDPVTLSTGMTFDRKSIHRWLFTYNRSTCPITKQPLTDHNLTPNTTLLRLIQSWRINNASKFISAVEVPKPTFDISMFIELVDKVREPQSQIKALREIRSLIEEREDNRRYVEEAGIVSLIASIITSTDPQGTLLLGDSLEIKEEATNVLHLLKASPEALKRVSEQKNGELIEALSMLMQKGSYQARFHATLLLKSIFEVVDDTYKTGLKAELFDGVVETLKDQNSNRATKAALSILIKVAPFGTNIARAIEAGVAAVLVELLLEINERRSCEIMLRALEIVCGRAEGRAAFLAHPASVAAVSSKILRVSEAADEKAVKVLLQVCRCCGSGAVVQEMVVVGGAVKVFMVAQAQGSRKVKEMARQILGLHLKTWNKSPCFSSGLRA